MNEKTKIAKLIYDIEAKCDDHIIFRGTNKKYEKISSNLYRWANDNSVKFTDNFTPFHIEKEIVESARRHFPANTDNIEILTEIQHFKGYTNLIDFSRNLHIALFFACDDEIEDGKSKLEKDKSDKSSEFPGELILFKCQEFLTELDYEAQPPTNIMMVVPTNTQGSKARVNFQCSVFVYPPKGFIKNKYETIVIKHNLKKPILNWLDKFHNINRKTIYNDFIGFIQDKENFKTANIHFYQGNAYFNENKFEDATDNYDKAIAINPNYAVTYYNRGNTKANLNKFEDAIDDYDKAIAINPNYADAYNNRGLANSKQKKYDEAFKDYDKAIAINPNYAEAYNNRGTAKDNLNKFNDVIDDYDKAIAINPNYADAYGNRGNAWLELGEYEKAIKDFNAAIKINPQFSQIYFNIGDASFQLKQYDDAIKGYSKAIELDPNDSKAYYFRGKAKAGFDDKEGAQADFKIAKDLGCKLPIPPEFID